MKAVIKLSLRTWFSISLVLLWVAMPVTAQIYYEDDFSKNTIGNYETAGGAKWMVEKGELLSRGAGGDWNVLVLKEKFWKGWTDYTYEVKVTPTKAGSEFIYIMFRYAQPVSTNRQNFHCRGDQRYGIPKQCL